MERSWDHLAEQLQQLRRSVGDPSYAEIARRVAEQRVARGATPEAARVARTTVYDAFRTGRSRIDIELVREIARALGGDDSRVDGWMLPPTVPPVPPVTTTSAAVDPGAQPAPRAEAQPEAEPEAEPDPRPDPEPESAPVRSAGPSPSPGTRLRVLLLLACVALNVAGRAFQETLSLPLHLDMVGTAVVAIALGPWWGAGVGLATNVVGVLASGGASLPFALVNVAGALVWGYGVHRWGLGRSLPRFLGLCVLVALACSAVAVPILLLAFDGSTGHAETDIAIGLLPGVGEATVLLVLAANVLVSIGDKVISGFVALALVAMLPLAHLARTMPFLVGAPRADG